MTGATSVRILHHGRVVHSSGPQDLPMPVHSIRKSFISALFGQLVADGQVRLDTTLTELGIDDSPALTAAEAGATLEHLLTSRSGIYLPLMCESSLNVLTAEAMAWPARGSSAPGTRFLYNNWDFNVLGEIYQRVCGTALFVAIDRLLAQPLGFQDWDVLAHAHFRYGPDPLGSTMRYPNYAVQFSARDLASFGQLYLDGGTWQGDQLVPADWVQRSTAAVVATGLPDPFGHYGYLWWVVGGGSTIPAGSYAAAGVGGQTLVVIPSHELVIVTLNQAPQSFGGPMTAMAIDEAVVGAALGMATS